MIAVPLAALLAAIIRLSVPRRRTPIESHVRGTIAVGLSDRSWREPYRQHARDVAAMARARRAAELGRACDRILGPLVSVRWPA